MVPPKKNSEFANQGIGRPAHSAQCWSILDNAPEIFALIDAQGTILYTNAHLTTVLGHGPERVQGRNIFEFIHDDDRSRAMQEYSNTLQSTGERIPSVIRLRDSADNWIPVEIIANNQLQNPSIRAVIFTARDLRFRHEVEEVVRGINADAERGVEERTTELAKINASLRIENQARRQAEHQLQKTVSLLNATLDSTADGILVVSTEGMVSSCNRRFIEMWGMDCEFVNGIDDELLLSQVNGLLKNPTEFLEKVRSLYANPTATSSDELHLRDGRILERYSQPQKLDGIVVGRVWSFRDVTHARNIELELRQAQKMEALGRLAGGIAHDFNNLLMLISGYVTNLLEEDAAPVVNATCEQILISTKRAAAVTRQLLAFSRKHPDAPTIADLNVILLDMERMLRRVLSDQVKLKIAVANSPQPIYADISQIELVLLNLAINAQDAMPEGGSLSISILDTETSFSEGAMHEVSEGFAVLQVKDTGHGMTAEVKSHLFEPFFTTKQVGKGTGLGLSTVLGIVTKVGGRIDVRSEPGMGATFRICLPKISASPISVRPSALVAPSGGHETILLAEDEAGIRAMTRAYLESLGYRVLEAADGVEAIRLSLEYTGTIHLVVTDVLMPEMRGDTAVEKIQRERPGIKAIFVSGYTDAELVRDVEQILYKPYEFPELGRRVRAVLDDDSSGTHPAVA